MTSTALVTAVPTDLPQPAASPPMPARVPAHDFRVVLDAQAAAVDGAMALHAPRARPPETTGEAFEAAMLVPFVAAMLPPEDAEIWGGTGGAMWRGLFADAVAADLARAGGLGVAHLVDKLLAARLEPSTKPHRGDPA